MHRSNKLTCLELIKFITEDTKVKHTNSTTISMLIKTESIYKSK